MRLIIIIFLCLSVAGCSSGRSNNTLPARIDYSGMQAEYCRGFVGGFRIVAGLEDRVPRCPIMAGLPDGMTAFDVGAATGMALACDRSYSIQEWTRVRHHSVEEDREVRS